MQLKEAQEAKAVAAHGKFLACFLTGVWLSGCSSTSVNIKEGVVPNSADCRPDSTASTEIAKSQMACHQGVAGDGVQVIISSTVRRATIRSDSTQRELTSIFIQPVGAIHKIGPVDFEAFYSRGLFDLTGKTGCVGVLKDGTVLIEKVAKKSVLSYSLRFKLISPLDWPEDCKDVHQITGKVDL